jgi:1,2-diacylglycerol 3-alpha-glucosyltransferase
MRIALFTDTYPPQINGVATATYTLAEVLKQHGNDVLVITICLEGQRRLSFVDGVVRIPGITLRKLYSYKMAWLFSSKVYRIIKEFDPELIHIQTEAGIGIFGRIVSNTLSLPLVYTYHTMYEDYTYYVTKGWKTFDLFAKRVVADFSAIIGDSTTEFITTSNKTKEALRRYGVKKYINVVPNGIDLSAFAQGGNDSQKREELKEKYGLKGKFTVLILGRLAKEKANDLIVKYLADYLARGGNPDFKLIVVGDGPDKENLMLLSSNLGLDSYISFLGPADHASVPLFYSLADLYVSASTSETQGLTYNEAMAASTLVLARYDENLSGIIEDGKTGFFFEDEDSFIEKMDYIRKMSPDEKEKIIKAAFARDMSMFSLDLYYERIMNVYLKAIRKYW